MQATWTRSSTQTRREHHGGVTGFGSQVEEAEPAWVASSGGSRTDIPGQIGAGWGFIRVAEATVGVVVSSRLGATVAIAIAETSDTGTPS